MSRSGTQICSVCQCRVDSGNCIHFTGSGTTDDPFIPTFNLDPIDGNMLECSRAGFGAFLPAAYLDPPAVAISTRLAQTFPWDTVQPMFFEQELYDTDSMYDDVEDSGEIVFNTPGVYLITLNFRWKKTRDNSATGDLFAAIKKNGTDFIAMDSFPVPLGDSFAKHSVAVIDSFAAGWFISAWAKQDVLDGDGEKMNLQTTVDVMRPVLTATFLRSAEGMSIVGFPLEDEEGDGGGGGGEPGNQYALNGTQWWETPDHSSLDITGNIDMRAAIAPTDWSPASFKMVLSKAPSSGDTGAAYGFGPSNTSSQLGFFWSRVPPIAPGTYSEFSTATLPGPPVDGSLLGVRIVIDNTTGNYFAYTKSVTAATALTDIESNSGWTQYWTFPSGVGGSTILANAEKLLVGANHAGVDDFFTGSIYAIVLKNGINGTTVANPDFYHNNSPFMDGSGRTWTKF